PARFPPFPRPVRGNRRGRGEPSRSSPPWFPPSRRARDRRSRSRLRSRFSSSSCSSGGFRRIAVKRLLERLRTDAPIGRQKGFRSGEAEAQIGIDDHLDRIRHLFRCKAAADDLADGGVLVAGAAKRDLVKLLALLLHSEK